MEKLVRTIVSCGMAILAASAAGSRMGAQDRAGAWEGSIRQNGSEFLVGLKTAHGGGGAWTATLFNSSIWPRAGVPAASVTVRDSLFAFSFSFGDTRYSYSGRFDSGTRSIEGVFAGGEDSFPLKFRRVNERDMRSLDRSSHVVQFITVQPDVALEVIDWGGRGSPMLFIPGAGHTAHAYDELVKHFTSRYHVYGLTRRGSGESSAPPAAANDANGNYSFDRLGDDVLTVLEKLSIQRPVLVGHSLGGEELSSICSRHSEKIAGLVYLDAVAPYSYSHSNNPPRSAPSGAGAAPVAIMEAIRAGQKSIDNLPCNILAFIPVPHIDRDAADLARMVRTANEFQAGVPSARVVRLKNADHAVWTTHESDVVREMNAFLPGAFRSEVSAAISVSSAKAAPPAEPAAPITGTWQGVLRMQGPRGGERPISLQMQLDGTNLTGTVTGATPGGKEAPILNGKLAGDRVSFELPAKEPDGKDMWIIFNGTVKGVTIEGTNAVRTSDPQAPLRKMASVWVIQRK